MTWIIFNVVVPLVVAAAISAVTGLFSCAFVSLTTTVYDKEDLP